MYVDELVKDAHDWVGTSKENFNETLSASLNEHCTKMRDYLNAKQLIDSCYALMSYDMASTSFITVRLDQLRERIN